MKHLNVPMDIGGAVFACIGARWEEHALPLAESAHVSGLRTAQTPPQAPAFDAEVHDSIS
ncbi:hypothetical protein KSD_77120 [Ktedonobacter sp. SOSP1-85]|uniref:hypothetical protein n=1 Tax=Ktedonobacter sp. SOSP1-85 TaxID=2778367 RepID=UPI0019164F21|nr:hypothetical protein [Ktedonobacter sp. SOSP1-85]GHO79941.1 hypothetical protein KSD_77120 [Ktedonobacter sp. SOSP1-85]